MLYLGIKIFNVAVIVGTSSFLISSISEMMLIKMYLLIPVEVHSKKYAVNFLLFINVFIFIVIKFQNFVE